MQSLNVVVLSSGLAHRLGGAAVSEASLCSALKRSCRVSVLCRQSLVESKFLSDFGLVEVLRYRPSDVWKAWQGKHNAISKVLDQADVFHINGHWRWENYFFSKLCTRKNIPYVLHPRGMLLVGHRRIWIKRCFNALLGKAVVRSASKVIALSDYEKQQFSPYQLQASKVKVVPNGISKQVEPFALEQAQKKDPYFLYLGRLESRKNLVFLLEAYSQYVKRAGSAKLILAGPVERRYDRTLRERTSTLSLRDRVELMPPAYGDKKWALLRDSLAVIYPAREEAFGRVPFEAVAAGSLPIIPDASGSSEYLAPFFPFSIYEEGKLESLCQTLLKVEALTAHKTEVALTEAKQWIHKELCWDKISRSVLQIYSDILKGSVAAPINRNLGTGRFAEVPPY